MIEPDNREVLNYERPASGDFGPLVRQLRGERGQAWGFYIVGVAFVLLGVVGALFHSALARAIMVPVSFPVREISLALGAVTGIVIALVGLNQDKAVADIHQRGIRFRSVFKSLDIPFEGIASVGWNSKAGTVFQYRNGARLKTGQLLAREIYDQLMTLSHSPPGSPSPQAQVKPPSDLGKVIMLFKADRGWMMIALMGFSLFPVLFLFILFAASASHEKNPSRIIILICLPLVALVCYYVAHLYESRLIRLHEAGVSCSNWVWGKWSCHYSEIAVISTMTTTQTTSFLGVLPVGQSKFVSGITLHLKDGRILKADRIAQLALAVQMIQGKLHAFRPS